MTPTTSTRPARLHGLVDYMWSALLIASPWVCGFTDERVNRDIALILGCAVALYSFCTDYELGVMRGIPRQVHLTVDMLVGVFLGSAFMHIAMATRGGVVFAILGVAMLVNVFATPRPRDTSTS
ncbi:MAG TPA: SPW repeat protein [Chthoniobacter sp.]|nr:SPW repeat protein [Chthoniobacter sp.]